MDFANLAPEFIQAAQRLPAVVSRVLLQPDTTGDAKAQATALMSALPSQVRRSSARPELARIPAALSTSACRILRAAVDQQRSVARDSVDLAPEHQRNLNVEQLTALVGQEEAAKVLSLPKRLHGSKGKFAIADYRVEMMLRRYTRDTRPWIQFHCDKAAVTVNVALAADRLHEGGRLICVIDDELKTIERDEGEATVHPSSLLHAVTAMGATGTRYSLIIFFHRRADELQGGPGVDPSGLLLRAGREPHDRRALVPTLDDGFGSVWLFAVPKVIPEHAWVAARERFETSGIGIIDEFMETDAALELHEYAYRLYVTHLSDFETSSAGRDSAGVEAIREDHRLQLSPDDKRLPHLGEWLSRVDAFVAFLAERIPALGSASHRSRPMLVIYPGGGSTCSRHVDNPANRNGRILTMILYLNPGWIVQEHGGALRLWAPDQSSVVESVAPLLNRLVFFWSDSRTPHEVLATQRDRLAISMWYSDAKCAGKCSHCGQDTTRRCCTIFYCSKECQLADWKNHKAVCDRRKR